MDNINVTNKLNNNLINNNNMTKLTSKRFVIRQSLIGKNVVIEFTNKKGVKHTYNHDKAYNIMKANLSKMACFIKYKSYTATNNIPVVLRNADIA